MKSILEGNKQHMDFIIITDPERVGQVSVIAREDSVITKDLQRPVGVLSCYIMFTTIWVSMVHIHSK